MTTTIKMSRAEFELALARALAPGMEFTAVHSVCLETVEAHICLSAPALPDGFVTIELAAAAPDGGGPPVRYIREIRHQPYPALATEKSP